MLDLSSSEVLSFALGQRMQAILNTQSVLPMSLLMIGGERVDSSGMPLYVAGHLRLQSGMLERLTVNQGGDYVLDFDRNKSIVLRSDVAPQTHNQYLSWSNEAGKNFVVLIRTQRLATPIDDESGSIYILSEHGKHEVDGIGCRLEVITEGSGRLILSYGGPFTYSVVTTRETGAHVISGTEVDKLIELRLDCSQ